MTGKTSTAFNKDAGRNLHTPAHRLEGESHDEYKARRTAFNRKQKDYSRGTMVRPGKRQEAVLFNGKEVKNPKTGKTLTETVSNPPFRGSVSSLIKGQA